MTLPDQRGNINNCYNVSLIYPQQYTPKHSASTSARLSQSNVGTDQIFMSIFPDGYLPVHGDNGERLNNN
jgi:hypothetical protein